MIRITSKQDGFRRCGIAHPAAATEYPDDHFTAAELAAMQQEPTLLVEVMTASGGKSLNVQQTVELVIAAASIEDLDKLSEGESRKGVLDAIAKRRAELAPAPE